MSSNRKVRILLEDPRENHVCLRDLIMMLAAMSADVSTLEYSNSSKLALTNHKRDLRKFAKALAIYRTRIKDEVQPDIIRFLEGAPKKPRGRSENIIEFNQKRSENLKNKQNEERQENTSSEEEEFDY